MQHDVFWCGLHSAACGLASKRMWLQIIVTSEATFQNFGINDRSSARVFKHYRKNASA